MPRASGICTLHSARVERARIGPNALNFRMGADYVL